MALLEVRDLGVRYRTRRGPAHALDDVSFALEHGQMLGIVGESGCGKTTLGLALMGLLAETATVTGQVMFDGSDVSRLSQQAWRHIRGKDIAMVFQGAMNAWNPVYPVGDQIVEAILVHEPQLRRSEARARVAALYSTVGLRADCLDDFPHEYSGGMKQRAVIAMALAANPKLVIADEPTTALDVIVQHEILRELKHLRRDRDFSIVYISHDVAVVAELVDVVAVMYAGRIVEIGPVASIFARPAHPYTAALLAASPSLHGSRRAIHGLAGAPPSLVDPPAGCRFAERCRYATEHCSAALPPLAAQRDGLATACWHPLPGERGAATDESPRMADSAAERTSPPIVRFERAQKVFGARGGFLRRAGQGVRAVDDVTLDIVRGEALGLVGGSGSGKTTLGRLLLGLGEPTGGSIRLDLDGTSLALDQFGRREFRRHVQMIFQDPYESLNPRMTIGAIVAEPLEVLRIESSAGRAGRVARMLERVGLQPAGRFIERYPHELSGGQRQRVAIARAMIVEPRLVVADEEGQAAEEHGWQRREGGGADGGEDGASAGQPLLGVHRPHCPPREPRRAGVRARSRRSATRTGPTARRSSRAWRRSWPAR